MNKRTFRVAPGKALSLPKSTQAGPGGRCARFKGGELIELDASKVDRFIRRRIAAGDLIEVSAPSSPPAAPARSPKEG